MSLIFPSSPSSGTIVTRNGRSYKWNGKAWEFAGGGTPVAAWSSVPELPTSSGTAGDVAYDGTYFYTATAANTWKRVAWQTWLDYLVLDTFTAGDGTSVSGRSVESGNATPVAWSSYTAGNNAAASVIRSNKLVADNYASPTNNNYSFSVVDCGAADATITATVSLGSRDVSYAYAGVVARWSDNNNKIMVMVRRSGTVSLDEALFIWQMSSGSLTTISGTAGTGTSLSTGTEYTLTVTLSGTSITASLSNGLSVSATSSLNQSSTTHGVLIGHTDDSGSGTVTSIDNFRIT